MMRSGLRLEVNYDGRWPVVLGASVKDIVAEEERSNRFGMRSRVEVEIRG